MPDTPDILQAKQNQAQYSQVKLHKNLAWNELNFLNDVTVNNWRKCWINRNEWLKLAS